MTIFFVLVALITIAFTCCLSVYVIYLEGHKHVKTEFAFLVIVILLGIAGSAAFSILYLTTH